MKMDKKLSASGWLCPLTTHQPLDPAGGSAPDPRLGSRSRHVPRPNWQMQILDPPLINLYKVIPDLYDPPELTSDLSDLTHFMRPLDVYRFTG